ncbi:heme-degrading domain-containing protein [Rhizobium sp. CFBP 8762]|uniref:heme-degrading domain-containing protein n=1 Tax=Rhizobium sp. CFBP 8762 TaxID=2775279 RepID=UPI0017822093|nr:heme-degrading domain-containing protein [Rhizobium sp. CFBP 8762]MBD8556815.1 heme-degrading domain-containing protein [Rhizobium sp. CFBP 8762]
MSIEQDLARIAEQEADLRFDTFDLDAAWVLGSTLRDMAANRQLAVAIDVHLHSMPVFYAALAGTTPDNAGWVARKRNTALRFFRSSYAIGLELKMQGRTLQDKFALADADYASHGGSFPVWVKGAGCIGAVTVSGLPQRDDHNLVVEALALMLCRDVALLALPLG